MNFISLFEAHEQKQRDYGKYSKFNNENDMQLL